MGDRLGRKFVLLATITLMGTASTLIGVLPTYASVGYWAPVMLVVLRLLQGLGTGAEQAGASVLMTEYAPRERRGFFAALPFMGIQLGTVAASLIYFVLLLQVQDVAQTLNSVLMHAVIVKPCAAHFSGGSISLKRPVVAGRPHWPIVLRMQF
jgi:MHS family metabolite:H+ symporter-like MFS transporter